MFEKEKRNICVFFNKFLNDNNFKFTSAEIKNAVIYLINKSNFQLPTSYIGLSADE